MVSYENFQKMLRHLLETLVLSFYGKKGNTNSIGQLRTFCILLHLQSNVFYPSSTFYKFLIEGHVNKGFSVNRKIIYGLYLEKTKRYKIEIHK